MSLLIPGTNSIKDTGYNVANSLRFNLADSARLTRTQTSGDRNKATFSAWIKRGKLGANQAFFGIHGASSDAGQIEIRFQSSGEGLHITGQATNWRRTNNNFRDVSAWMHVVVAFDTTLSTADDRVKVYVNGVQETSFASSSNPSQDSDLPFGLNSATCTIGSNFNAGSAGDYFGGYLAEVVLIDGTALDPTSFGEFDEDSPTIWKPKDVSGLTFGNNGFHLDFEDSSSLGNDAVGSNNFTATNLATTDQSTDTCTNNFCTLNPLDMTESTGRTFSEGNLNYTSDGSNASSARGTFGVNTGKWYYEVKIVSQSGSASSTGKFGTFGFTDIAEYSSPATNGLTIISDSRLRGQGSTSGSSGSAIWGVGDILMFALDLDNQNLYVGKNGSWRASDGDFDDSSPSSAIFSSIDTTKFWTPFGQKNVSADNTLSYSMNFGSPSFSISSGNADGNGHGNFEYAVPSGYFSLCTKNLAESG